MTLADHFSGGHSPSLVTGEFANSPAGATDDAEVRIPSFDGGAHHFEVLGWVPRGTVLPNEGDPCLVARDENGDMWVVSWMPA